ncbi:MAG: glycosyltransferase [Acetatifactor sp.]|nr:glycosyltransferase [Acetatifactor sp.]
MTEKTSLVMFKTQLNTLNHFSDLMKKKFIELGYEIFDFDCDKPMDELGRLYAYMQERKVLAMIGFNSNFYSLKTPSGVNVWETLGIYCINILVDHPYWYHNILLETPATGVILTVDRDHMKYVTDYYENVPTVGFLPHGGTSLSDKVKPVKDRETDLLYVGCYFGESYTEPDLTEYGPVAKKVCESAIRELIERPEQTIPEVLKAELLKENVVMTKEEFRLFMAKCVYIERVVGSHFREKIIKAFADAGINITIYGRNWEKCGIDKYKNVEFKGFVSPEKVIELMNDSKMVLNSMPWFKDGSHERIYNSMLNGAVPVTETSRYLEETIPEGLAVMFGLSDGEISEGVRRVKELLKDPAGLQEMSDGCREFALKGETWEHRAEEIHRDLLMQLI